MKGVHVYVHVHNAPPKYSCVSSRRRNIRTGASTVLQLRYGSDRAPIQKGLRLSPEANPRPCKAKLDSRSCGIPMRTHRTAQWPVSAARRTHKIRQCAATHIQVRASKPVRGVRNSMGCVSVSTSRITFDELPCLPLGSTISFLLCSGRLENVMRKVQKLIYQ